MKNGTRIGIVVVLAAAVAATFALRSGKRAEYVPPTPAPSATANEAASAPAPAAALAPAATSAPSAPVAAAPPPAPSVPAAAAVAPAASAPVEAAPRLLELGSMRCMACLEMAKVLDALRASQGSKLQVDFIDVFEQPEAADRHRITLIPTQILYDGAGKEIFRHTGYFSHDDILAKFRELGVKL